FTGRIGFRPGLEQIGGNGFAAGASRSRLPLCKPEIEHLEQRSLMTSSGLITSVSSSLFYADYAIASDHSLLKYDAQGVHKYAGYVTQISAGLDSLGLPEVFAIAGDHSCWLLDGRGWHNLGGFVTQISGTRHNQVYAIDGKSSPWLYNPQTGWHALGG